MVTQVLLVLALVAVVLHGLRWYKKDGELSLFYLGVLLIAIALNWHEVLSPALHVLRGR